MRNVNFTVWYTRQLERKWTFRVLVLRLLGNKDCTKVHEFEAVGKEGDGRRGPRSVVVVISV